MNLRAWAYGPGDDAVADCRRLGWPGTGSPIEWLVAEFERLRGVEAELRQEAGELRALFDLQWERTREADAAYLAAHPRPDCPHGYRPDLGKLIGWLLECYRYVEAEPCRCADQWGNLKPQPCERCRLLGQRLREAENQRHGFRGSGVF